jgi:hypothetical protein
VNCPQSVILRRPESLGDVVDDVQDALAPGRDELVVHEIDGPACVRHGHDEDRLCRLDDFFAMQALAKELKVFEAPTLAICLSCHFSRAGSMPMANMLGAWSRAARASLRLILG